MYEIMAADGKLFVSAFKSMAEVKMRTTNTINNTNSVFSQEHLLWQLSGYIGVKDTQSKFLWANKNCVNLLGFKSLDWFVGSTDFDIPCEASKFAEQFIAQDRQVLRTKSCLRLLEIRKYADNNIYTLLTTKTPLLDISGVIIGVIAQLITVDRNILMALSKMAAAPAAHDYSHLIGSHKIGSYDEKCDLTQREEETLYYLLRGNTAAEIAARLKISRRTVEIYVDNLKGKFGCDKKSHLITKCIEDGFMNVIPHSLFLQQCLVA